MGEGKEQRVEYDIEWIQLMMEAKKLGIKMEEIKHFLQDQEHK